MLRATRHRLGGGHGPPPGLDLHALFPNGVPKRSDWNGPFQQIPKHPALAPHPGGYFVSKVNLGIPFMPPFDIYFWRTSFLLVGALICYDLTFGFPVFFQKEKAPGTASHYYFGNNGGIPHHFWCYQDGWHLPNKSGVPRIME